MNDTKIKIIIPNTEFRDSILFKTDEFGIKRIQVPMALLEKIDLEGVNWRNVDVRGIDFSKTNADINPRLVYQRDLENTNLEGRDLSKYSLRGVNLNNTNLCNTNARIHSGEHILEYKLIRGCFLNGRYVPYFEDARYIPLKPKYEGKRLKKIK